MLSRFKIIGRVGFLKVRKYRNKKQTIHLSLAYQIMVRKKYVTMWNNNLTLNFGIHRAINVLRMGSLIYAEGNILSFTKDGQQINRFIIKDWKLLKNFDDVEEEHINRYGDLPPEEFYDTFDESTDALNGARNPFSDRSPDNPYEEHL